MGVTGSARGLMKGETIADSGLWTRTLSGFLADARATRRHLCSLQVYPVVNHNAAQCSPVETKPVSQSCCPSRGPRPTLYLCTLV